MNGKDVMDIMHIKSGKDVGYWLNEILNRVLDEKLKNDRDEIIYWMTGITHGWKKFNKKGENNEGSIDRT